VGHPRKFKSKIKSKFKNPKSTAPLNEKSVEWATCPPVRANSNSRSRSTDPLLPEDGRYDGIRTKASADPVIFG
jgi:hypothetical protein